VKTSHGRTILAIASTVVVGSIVAGVILVGSPERGRLQRLDGRRVEDLSAIVDAMDGFWERNDRLPASLAELTEDPRVRVSTLDPGSGDQYEYRLGGEGAYELCATFDFESPAREPRAQENFWTHSAGRQCFELRVDTSS